MKLKGTGRIEVNNGVRIVMDFDICRYYSWFIKKEFWNTIKTQIPKHGGHLTLVNPKIHKITDFSKVMKYNNRKEEFDYEPERLYISKVNFWIPANVPIGTEIKDLLGVVEGPNWYGDHITVANRKFNG